MTHVPFKGVGPALIDVVGGRVPVMLVNLISIKPHIETGKVRPLAVTSRKRFEALPNVPTISESGYPKYEPVQRFGLLAGAATQGDPCLRA